MPDPHTLADDRPKIQPEIAPDDNLQLPGYKALSGMAIASLILGLASPLSLADPWLWLLPGGAILTGAWALYRMAKLPGTLGGSTLAKAGIVLALVFGSASTASYFVSRWILLRDGRNFAEEFLAEVADGSVEKLQSAYWKKVPPESRRTMSPDDFSALLKQHGGEEEWIKFQNGPIVRYLGSAEDDVHWRFFDVEKIENWRGNDYLTVVYELVPPPRRHKQYYVMFHLVSWIVNESGKAQRHWVIEDMAEPYVPQTFQAPRGGHSHEH